MYWFSSAWQSRRVHVECHSVRTSVSHPAWLIVPHRCQVNSLADTERFIRFMITWPTSLVIGQLQLQGFWLTLGDSTLPLWSFSSMLSLCRWSWSFSFWRAWTCSEIFIFSLAVQLSSCKLFSDNSCSNEFRRSDIFRQSVLKSYKTQPTSRKRVTRNSDSLENRKKNQ